MSYPQLVEYQSAVQNPQQSFSDVDLKNGLVKTTQLGLPHALSGGFALTYSIENSGKKYAVRCFHTEVPEIQARYGHISETLKLVDQKYFVSFEYDHNGIVVNKNQYPIVKMDWAEGDTLNVYLAKIANSPTKIRILRERFVELARYLKSEGIAHGDIQDLNVICSDSSLKLIDYDGMYVPTIGSGKGNEIGHKDFQHPDRTASNFGPEMDRFSFIVIYIALLAIENESKLLSEFKSGGEALLFRANDYEAPNNAPIFQRIKGIPACAAYVTNLEAICTSGYSQIPSLDDFIQKANIPVLRANTAASTGPSDYKYISSYRVMNGADYDLCESLVGQKIEIVGKVVLVKVDVTKRGKKGRRGQPYVFINFGKWNDKSVKLTIWSDALANFASVPDSDLEGKWISCTGLIDPPYHGKFYGKDYSNVGITIERESQIEVISKSEADFRLGVKNRTKTLATKINTTARQASSSNRDILRQIKGGSSTNVSSKGTRAPIQTAPSTTKSSRSNKDILAEIKKSQGAKNAGVRPLSSTVKSASTKASTPTYKPSMQRATGASQNKSGGSRWVWWVVGIGGFLLIAVLSNQ